MANAAPLVVDLDLSTGDAVRTSYGDLALLAGQPWQQQRLYRRLVTNPGSLPAQPTYGAGLGGVGIGMPLTPDQQTRLTALVTQQVGLETWVKSVDSVSLALSSDLSTLTVTIAATPVGQAAAGLFVVTVG